MSSWIVPSADFASRYNQRPFAFEHQLSGHPLFQLDRLARLGESILSQGNPRNFAHFDGKGVSRSSYLPNRLAREHAGEAISRISEFGSWVKLTAVQEADAEYDALLTELLTEFEGLVRTPILKEMTWRTATIFIAAPGVVTPYHIDHTPNFLLQIGGEKLVNLFDPSDRSVLTEEEIECFYAGDDSAAQYRDHIQPKAQVFTLKPGVGVHQPMLAPHWVGNGDAPSISLSIAFCQRSLDVQARVYQINHYLRRLGLTPSPYGRSPLKDSAKILALGLVSTDKPSNYRETICSGVDRLRAWAGKARSLTRTPKQPSA